MRQTKKILIAPLNWGLGHATRCIPIIKELQRQNAEVLLASDGRALDLLRSEFPDLIHFELPPYGINYKSNSIILNVGREIPKMLKAIIYEHRMADMLIKKHGIDGIITDNRLGCYSKKVPSVFISHQINLIVPNLLLENASRWLNRWFIRKFNECWIPDVAVEPSLSGSLSHGSSLKNIRYLGALSRMENLSLEKKYDVIVVISGPEPQRTKLDQAILSQAKKLPYRFLIVQGKTEQNQHYFIDKNIEVVSFMTSMALNNAIISSDLFIGRSGYSSLMDLAKLRKPALLIPTPGQTEQEYLANRLSANGHFFTQTQEQLNLEKGIPQALSKGALDDRYFDEYRLEAIIRQFLGSL